MTIGSGVLSIWPSAWRSPFSLTSAFRRDMDELFSRFFDNWEWAGTLGAPLSLGYAPLIESYVDGGNLHIKADLPGINSNEVEIAVEGNLLTLKGERKTEHEARDDNYLQREVGYGSFARTFTLPDGVKAEDVHATYRNGVLDIVVPLPAALVPKKVPVMIGSEEYKQITA